MAVEAFGLEALERLRQLLGHQILERLQHAFRRRRALQELIREPDGAELEAFRIQQLIAVARHDLDGPAADVDCQGRLIGHRHAVLDAQENQPGFFCAADHTNP